MEGLQQYVDISGRNISRHRYFTSMSIAMYFLEKKIPFVGTLKASRNGIPKDISDIKDRKDLSTLYAEEDDKKLLLVSYVLKIPSGKRNLKDVVAKVDK